MAHHEICARCEGSGQIGCPDCRGTGIITRPRDFDEERRTCPACKGTGKNRCHACSGTGTVKFDS
ncbi:hypothetical protein [Dehalogenimonas sp. 4OHTPN]|uniref:Molecular chaperone DnaJ n=1 Tax=Dehalogenimonas sp. 4OHTPN TaxID=3166643 RepID=A0AAU8G976_9CHLR